jgi:hypothetical protein
VRAARLATGVLLLVMALPVSAQQPATGTPPAAPPAQDTTLTAEQRALQRLRGLGAVGRPDTLEVVPDTVRAQQVRATGADVRRAGVTPPASIDRD